MEWSVRLPRMQFGRSPSSFCATTLLVLGGCCNDIPCAGPVLKVTTLSSTGADRVEVVFANETWSCAVNDAVECRVEMADGETTFSLFDVSEGPLNLKVYAGDEMLSEKTVTPAWKDNNAEEQCETYSHCKVATVEP
jgi:hypothetical protein